MPFTSFSSSSSFLLSAVGENTVLTIQTRGSWIPVSSRKCLCSAVKPGRDWLLNYHRLSRL